MNHDYESLLARKRASAVPAGWDADITNPKLFDWQRETVRWACRQGRCALFADTGLGKTAMQLEWARAVVGKTGGRVLILAPLAVGAQTCREAAKFGIDGVGQAMDESEATSPITITNYERLHLFDASAYSGVVLDESSILKNVDGRTRRRLCEAFAATPYRLCCTATPAPNDYTELGNHSEFLSLMDEAVMRARWFINDLSETVAPWRIKRHAEDDFWRWVTSWSRCIGKPSDMGDYSDGGYNLPPLDVRQHRVAVDLVDGRGDGMLFRVPELSATSVHHEKRRTADDRAAFVADIVRAEPGEPWVVWCETNYEQDALMEVLPDAIDVRGNMTPGDKARLLTQFGEAGGVIVTKPSIAGMGLNWQHAARMAFVGGSYSYEAFYQAVRRCWRFGQARDVVVHVVMAATEAAMWHAINRKSDDHERMKRKMFDASRKAARRFSASDPYDPDHIAPVPGWLCTMEGL